MKAGFTEGIYEKEREIQTECPEIQKGKQYESPLCLGSGVFIGDCGLVLCSLSHPGTGQNKDRVHLSFISHSFPEVRGLDIHVFGVSGLAECL